MGTQPYITADTVEPTATWQLILAAQQNDAVTDYFIRQLMGQEQPAVNLDECDDEFKVMAHQFKNLSIAEVVRSHQDSYSSKSRESWPHNQSDKSSCRTHMVLGMWE